MPQTSYSVDNLAAVPGLVVSGERVIARYQTSEAIPFGCMAELHTDGKARVYRGGKKLGVCIYKDSADPQYDNSGEFADFLREGTIWAQVTDAGADLTKANFKYADTTTTDRGKATASVPSVASDAEVYDGGPTRFVGSIVSATSSLGTSISVCKLEVDFSAEAQGSAPTSYRLVGQTANNFPILPAFNSELIELNTTAANSTVSFDPNTPDGTVCYVLADGTKNGHTLTFRDGVTAISVATVASKRVAAVAMKAGGKWSVNVAEEDSDIAPDAD